MNYTTENIGPLTLVTIITERGIKVTGAYMEDFLPEMQAALGATLSRDPGSIESRLRKVFGSKTMSQRILDIYFKKYGHNSIGDMGTLMFSVEGLSMKGAFHLVEHQLFNGQEASTRYLNFSEMGFLPISNEVDTLSSQSMDLYKKVLSSEMKRNIEILGMSEKDAEPKAFDVAGAYLPISARTNVFWIGSIRTYIGKIRELRSMGREEKEIGEAMSLIFDKICPNSQRDVGENYMEEELLFEAGIKSSQESLFKGKKEKVNFNGFNSTWFKFVRGEKEKIQHFSPTLGLFGSISSKFEFDFRSARDIHRHRAFDINSVIDWRPLGFEKFYREQVSDKELLDEIKKLQGDSLKLYEKIGHESVYGMPMAMKFQYFMAGPLQAWLYFLDLRSGPKVHPTVIKLAQDIGKEIEEELCIKEVYQRGGADYGIRSKDLNKI